MGIHLPDGARVRRRRHEGRQCIDHGVLDVHVLRREPSRVIVIDPLMPQLLGVPRDASQHHPDRWHATP